MLDATHPQQVIQRLSEQPVEIIRIEAEPITAETNVAHSRNIEANIAAVSVCVDLRAHVPEVDSSRTVRVAVWPVVVG